MRAALYNGPHAIEVGDRPDPVITAPKRHLRALPRRGHVAVRPRGRVWQFLRIGAKETCR